MSKRKFFSGLNYSLGNEDTTLEVEMCRQLRPKSIFSIAGCGSRSLPLLSCGPEKIVCADVAREQLELTKLRLESIRLLSYREFLIFWGFPPFGAYDYTFERRELFAKIAPELGPSCREFFERIFEGLQWQSLLYQGKWEKTFAVFSKFLQKVMGKNYGNIFKCRTLEEQVAFYENEFPLRKWKFILFVLGNKAIFNALLYRGDFIIKNVPESHFDYYYQAFEGLFYNVLARESFFLHLCFHGEITHPDGNTIEAQEENFEACKKALENGAEVRIWEQNLLSLASERPGERFDFVSLSDVPSYFQGEEEKSFIQKLRPVLSPGAILVLRSYLRVPEADLQGFDEVTGVYDSLIQKECLQMYRIQVFKYTGQ